MKVEPDGKVEFVTVMSNVSLPLPVFTTVLVSNTVLPCEALARVSPVMDTPAPCVTWNVTVFAL